MAVKAATSFSLKDDLFNAQSVGILARALAQASGSFDAQRFCEASLSGFADRELKARIDWLVTQVGEQLPRDYRRALAILERALPAPLDPTRSDDDFGSFIWVVPGEYAARHGCTEPRLDRSLAFLRETTKRFSAENAIRPFLAMFPARTLAFLRECALDENYHVRRFASEGTRPALPWSRRVELPREEVLALLDALHADPTRYVTRSVANSLNDYSKLDPLAVIERLQTWRALGQQAPDELQWLTRHALRTLRKRHNPHAMALLGYRADPAVDVIEITAPEAIEVGGDYTWSAVLRSTAAQQLNLTLEIDFVKANGAHAAKVFKVGDTHADDGETLQLGKRISFRPMTTRVLYPGRHVARFIVNGKPLDERDFDVATA